MDEQNTTATDGQAAAQEQPAVNTGTGNLPPATSIIERADSIAKRIEEANKRAEELLNQNERLFARQLLGGKAAAGAPQKTAAELADEEITKQVEATLNRFK